MVSLKVAKFRNKLKRGFAAKLEVVAAGGAMLLAGPPIKQARLRLNKVARREATRQLEIGDLLGVELGGGGGGRGGGGCGCGCAGSS